MWRELNVFGRLRQALVHVQTRSVERSRPPSSTVLEAHSTVSTGARNTSVHLGMGARDIRVLSTNLSTLLWIVRI